MKQIVTKGIVLSRTNFGEADRILTVLTTDQGKVRLLAKGVRKSTSKLAGGIELFSTSYITFIVGRGEIQTLISTRLEKHYGTIVKDVKRTAFAYEVLKAVNKMTEEGADKQYYLITQSVLTALDVDTSLELTELWFYMQLLTHSGHSPNLSKEANGQKLAAGTDYNFSFDDGSFKSTSAGRYSESHIKLLRLAARVDSPQKLSQVQGVEAVIADSVQLAKTLLSSYVRL